MQRQRHISYSRQTARRRTRQDPAGEGVEQELGFRVHRVQGLGQDLAGEGVEQGEDVAGGGGVGTTLQPRAELTVGHLDARCMYMCMCVCTSVCLSVCLSVCCPYVCMGVYM